MSPSLERHRAVFVVNLGEGENRFKPDTIAHLQSLIDEIVATPGPKAMVTQATGRQFSSGLDLSWLREDLAGRREPTLRAFHGLLARTLCLPIPTTAAVQGHAFAGGAMYALCHDFQAMREGHGFWCLPEVGLGLTFTTGMTELLMHKLPMPVAHEAMTTAHRYPATEALRAGIIHDVALGPEDLFDIAFHRAERLVGMAGPALGCVKERMYHRVLAALDSDTFSPF